MKQQQWVGFVEVPGILLLRLMSRCNEKCLFCMVADEIALSDDVNFQAAVDKIAAQPQGTLIEFFGGEPTIYPRFLDLLHVARERGYPCSIASNVRIFHNLKFTQAVAELDSSKIYIRTSLYGDTDELHDYYTATPGSYKQSIQGIRNIVQAGFLCQVNVVILKQNVDRLSRIVEQVQSWGVPRIKFGNLISLNTCAAHAVPLSTVRPHLRKAIDLAERFGLAVTVEKTPICVASGRIDLMSTEREIYQSSRTYDDAGCCKQCLVRRWCDGFDPDYVARFGFDGIERLTTIAPVALKGSPETTPEPELLKMHCVEIADNHPDDSTLVALYELLQRVQAKHGRLAVFPRQYVRV